MKKKRSSYLVITGLVGCGICCLPLLLPVAAGAAGISFYGFTMDKILCGVLFLFLAMLLIGIYLRAKKKTEVVTCK